MPDVTHFHASVPDAMEVEVMLQLNRVGGMIRSVQLEAHQRTSIAATVPQKCFADFRVWLESYSGGRGHVSEDGA